MAQSESGEPFAPAVEEWIGGDGQRGGSQLRHGRDNGREFVVIFRVDRMDLHSESAARGLPLSNLSVGIWTSRIDEQSNDAGSGDQLAQQLQADLSLP